MFLIQLKKVNKNIIAKFMQFLIQYPSSFKMKKDILEINITLATNSDASLKSRD